MALALLELVDADDKNVTFRIDAGTNTRYQLQLGRATRETEGGESVDDVYYRTPVREIEGGAGFYGQPVEITVPLAEIERGHGFAQLFTSKAGGMAHTQSEVVALPGAALIDTLSISRSLSVETGSGMSMIALMPLRPARQMAHRTAPVSRQTSIESLLGEIVKIASPIVIDLLKGAATGNGGVLGTTGASNSPLVQVLKSIVDAIAAPAGFSLAQQPVSQQKSLTGGHANRLFAGGGQASYAKPFIFGIDDALIASLAGPLIQVLPQLMNAANQKRIDIKKADNALISGIISDINKRLMMDKLLEAQQAAQAQGPAAPISEEQIKAIADLLAQTPTPAPAPTSTVTPPLAGAKSITPETVPPYDLHSKAVLAFTFPTTLDWNGKAMPVFDRTAAIVLRPRFTVVEPAPKNPLSKAIIKLAIYDGASQATRYEKLFKLKGVLANSDIECRLEPGELSHLPADRKLCVVGELRWRNERSGRETRALGSTEIVLAGKYFLKSLGLALSEERELSDMAQFRSFWNKIWEAPALDSSRKTERVTKYAWDFDMNARYTALLTASQDSNGLMETRLLTEADDPDRPTLNIRGRMKAGIEISIRELNKLLALWNGQSPLDPVKLEALGTRDFLDGAAREFKYNFKLKGRAGQAGMIWVVPVLKLHAVTLSSITAVNQNGQATATADETVQFPLPVAARLIGLKSAA